MTDCLGRKLRCCKSANVNVQGHRKSLQSAQGIDISKYDTRGKASRRGTWTDKLKQYVEVRNQIRTYGGPRLPCNHADEDTGAYIQTKPTCKA